MLRSRDIPESTSASESAPYSDFEIVCPPRQPRRVCLCAKAFLPLAHEVCGALPRSAMEQRQFTGSCIALSGSSLFEGIVCVLLQDMKLD